jgi:hypothetical protein
MQKNSPVPVENEYVVAMGLPLAKVCEALSDDVTWLHAKWMEFRTLYGYSKERIDLLNETAGFFFRVVQEVLWDDILLHVARLTDRAQTGSKENLVLARLPKLIEDPALSTEVETLAEVARQKCMFARDWRNRRLAHSDLALATGSASEGLSAVSRQNIEEVLAAIRKVLNEVHRRYLGSDVGFEHVMSHSGADMLLYRLRVASHVETKKRQRLLDGKPLAEDFEEIPEA